MIKKVLVADDEGEVLALVSAILEGDERYLFRLVNDGEEALRIARKEKPDLVLLDILMPNMDGYEVCRALKSDPGLAHIKVIILTALDQEPSRQKAMEAGADYYLTKPFSPTTLLKKVQEFLALR